jgi:hypothetical protein
MRSAGVPLHARGWGRRENVANLVHTRLQWNALFTGARRLALGSGTVLLLALAVALAGCSLSSSSTSTPSSSTVALTQIPWCDQASIAFQDDGQASLPILTNWNAVKGQLGFQPYLPTSLPRGTCLALAGGTIRDPILGAQFGITYILPQTGPLSFSEAPAHGGQAGNLSTELQCSQAAQTGPAVTPTPGATPVPLPAVCLGVLTQTSITIASRQSTASLTQLFKSLQPDVEWLPQGTGQTPGTPTASGS